MRLVPATLVAIVALSLMPVAAQSPIPHDPKLWARALRLHRSAIVVDTHSDTTTRMLDEHFDMGPRAKDGHMDLPRIAEGGLDAQFFSIYVDKEYVAKGGSARRALDMIDALDRQLAVHGDKMELATTAADVRRIVKKGKLAALMGIEGGHAIEDSLGALRMFYKLGVRYMTLTHTNTNDWADSAGTIDDDPATLAKWHGLNDFGRQVVAEMNRLGMLVDISHVSDETFYDVMEVTKAPVIASHSSCRALCDHPRNMTDDMLRALGKNGGVVMINFYDTFLDQRRVDELRRLRPERRALGEKYADPAERSKALDAFDAAHPLPATPFKVLVDHIDHAVKVAGVDHVGFGADLDGGITTPEGFRDVRDLPEITYALLERGYSEADVRKILGENILRVMAQAEQVSRGLQTGRR